jgi:trehalose/maltose transport system substrate-binding protein
MSRKEHFHNYGWLALALIFLLCLSGCAKSQSSTQPVTLVFSTITFSHALYHGDPDIITDFTKRTGIRVKLLPFGNVDMGARRIQHLTWLKSRAATPDVYEADIIDVGTLAPYALDLTPFLDQDDREHMPSVMANLTFGQRVVALPVHTDVGLLFYRTDLLKKYGYKHPPKTWDELEAMAARIQAGERHEGNKDFWGFVWEGSPQNEGLTYTALEWQASNGGGQIIEPDGTISVNNPWTIAALRRARKWVGTISPPAVTAYQLEDLANAWDSGHAAFMRNWPYYYSWGQTTDSLSRDRFDAAPLPGGLMGSAATLGGWQLIISPYSAHTKEAVALVQYLTSRETQLRLGREFSWMPTRAALYDDPDLLRRSGYFRWLKPEFEHLAVARPSAVTGEKYLQVSEAYKQAVHDVVTGRADAGEAMAKLESQLVQITGFPVRRPAKPLSFTRAPAQ